MEKSPPPPYSAQAGFNVPPQQGAYPPPPQGGYAPAPQAGYVPQHQANIVVTPIVTTFGPEAMTVACPYCHHQISTRVETEPATKTHLFALILCLFGCIPCCLIPYCTDSCQNRNHYCPSCGAFLGAYTN